jgi:hypothetical protein
MFKHFRSIAIAASALALLIVTFVAHTQNPQTTRGVLRLKVKFKSDAGTRELPRKRFFLIKGSLAENQSLIEKIKQTPVMSRDCYYRSRGASDPLIKWLTENDCESLHCREIEDKYVSGSEAVPEFKAAYEQGLKEFKSSEVARRWLTVNVRPELREGFYDQKRDAINALITQAESATHAKVVSVMTDRKGTAYLTDIEPGTYTISNLVGSETNDRNVLWVCEREIKVVDLYAAMKRPFTLSNEKDPKVKCEVIERPLPACAK